MRAKSGYWVNIYPDSRRCSSTEAGELVRARQKIQTAIFQRRIVEGNPDRNRVAAVEGPVRYIEVKTRGVGKRLFDERLVVPDVDAVDVGQHTGESTESDVVHELVH